MASSEQQWAIVDLFGHTRVAGKISEHTIGGETFVRLDVPRGDGFTTELYGKGAIYSIKFVDEPIARESARRVDSVPVAAYTMADVVRQLAPQGPGVFAGLGEGEFPDDIDDEPGLD
jgi:hypothetical protein